MNNLTNLLNMKIIKVWADMNSTGIFDAEGNIILKDETTITNNTWIELQKWVNDYEFIIPMTLKDRKTHQDNIMLLDNAGIELLHRIQSEWDRDIHNNEPIQFKYYSEGLMKFFF